MLCYITSGFFFKTIQWSGLNHLLALICLYRRIPHGILLIEPGKGPVLSTTDGSLESMQAIVVGPIQAVYPFDEPIVLICNEKSTLMDLPSNRLLRYPDTGNVYDLVVAHVFSVPRRLITTILKA